MRISERRVHGTTVLELHGMFTGTAAELLDATVRQVTRGGPQRLVLNLRDVPSIDAAGLGALVAAYGAVRRSGGTFRLAHVGARVRTLLVVCRLVTVFETFDSVEDAVADDSETGADRSTNGYPAPQLSQTSVDVIHQFLRRA